MVEYQEIDSTNNATEASTIGSAPFAFPSKADFDRMLRSAGIALSGFAAAYITTDLIPQIDQKNAVGMFLVAVLGFVVNTIRIWLADTREEIADPIQVVVVDGKAVVQNPEVSSDVAS